MVSLLGPPLRMSLPVSPCMVSLPSPETILSLPRLPQRWSLPRLPQRWSPSRLPFRWSLPRLPLRRSSPSRPVKRSDPRRPVKRSSLSVPTNVSSPAVPVKTFARASWATKRAPTITTITVNKVQSLFIGLPPLVHVELVLLAFFRTHQQTVVLGFWPTMVSRSPLSQAQRYQLRDLSQPQRTSENAQKAKFAEYLFHALR